MENIELQAVTLEGERWAQYPSNNAYLISSIGRVWSTRSTLKNEHKAKGLLTVSQELAGYMAVSLLFTEGEYKVKRIRIHRLVAETYIANPLNLPEVNHIDGDKTNNTIPNLEWVTHAENIKKSFETGQRVAKSGIDHWLTGKRVKPETRLKQSEAKKGTKHPKFKGHYVINGKIFESANQAAIAFKTSTIQIIRRTKNPKFPDYQFIPIVT